MSGPPQAQWRQGQKPGPELPASKSPHRSWVPHSAGKLTNTSGDQEESQILHKYIKYKTKPLTLALLYLYIGNMFKRPKCNFSRLWHPNTYLYVHSQYLLFPLFTLLNCAMCTSAPPLHACTASQPLPGRAVDRMQMPPLCSLARLWHGCLLWFLFAHF